MAGFCTWPSDECSLAGCRSDVADVDLLEECVRDVVTVPVESPLPYPRQCPDPWMAGKQTDRQPDIHVKGGNFLRWTDFEMI